MPLALVAKGLLIAPLIPGLILIASRNLSGSSLLLLYPVSLVVGVPILLIYEMLGLRRLWHYLAGGFTLSFLVALMWLRQQAPEVLRSASDLTSNAAAIAALFSTAIATFWFIAIKPSRTAATPPPPE